MGLEFHLACILRSDSHIFMKFGVNVVPLETIVFFVPEKKKKKLENFCNVLYSEIWI
jgi:hypothetical protein